MVHGTVRFVLCAIFVWESVLYCDGQFSPFSNYELSVPLPFPTCKADDIDCLRRGLRTFFILMDSGHLGMKSIDPIIINSVAVAFQEEQTTFLLRRINVTGARWSKLLERRVNIEEGRNSALFSTDLHITGDLFMSVPDRLDPFVAFITMDIQGVESNVSYTWTAEKGIDNEDYILIGSERVAVRNAKLPTFFLQPKSEAAFILEKALVMKPLILEHLSNEITTSLVHSIVDNFRLFSSKVPVKYYYTFH